MAKPRMHHVEKVGAFLSREALHEKVVAFAEAEFDRRGQCPFLWAIYDGDTIVWIDTPWEDEHEKVASIRLIHRFLKETNARAYSHVMEAWMASCNSDKYGKPDDDDFILPSARPESERDDVLMILTYDRKGGWQGTRYKVTVRKQGYNFLGPRDDETFKSYDGGLAGRMGNLFDKA